MDFNIKMIGDAVAIVRPNGRLTMVAASELKAVVERAVTSGRISIVVDLAETTFMDSSGLGALVGGLRATRAAGGNLRIARPGAQVLTVLELTTMDRVLHPYGSVEDALSAGG